MEAYREADDVRGPPTNPRDKKRLNVFEIFGNLFFVYIAYTPRACDGARCRLAKGDDRDALIFDAPHTCCGLYGRCCSL